MIWSKWLSDHQVIIPGIGRRCRYAWPATAEETAVRPFGLIVHSDNTEVNIANTARRITNVKFFWQSNFETVLQKVPLLSSLCDQWSLIIQIISDFIVGAIRNWRGGFQVGLHAENMLVTRTCSQSQNQDQVWPMNLSWARSGTWKRTKTKSNNLTFPENSAISCKIGRRKINMRVLITD